MTQEDKKLLLQDLSVRLPYSVICRTRKEYSSDCDFVDKGPFVGILIDVCYDVKKVTLKSTPLTIRENYDFSVEEIIPYLRPMSSMTDEERKYKLSTFFRVINTNTEGVGYIPTLNSISAIGYIDWLNSHHFDYRGLIEKGLALEAPKDMYK